jgi:hypothetical protein
MVSDGMGGPVGEVVSGAGAPGAVDDAGGSGVPVSVTVGTGAGCWSLPAAPLISTRRIRQTTIATTTAPANTIATISGPLLFRGDGVGVDACQALPSQYRRFGAPEGSGYQPEPDGPVITHGHYAAADQRPPEQQGQQPRDQGRSNYQHAGNLDSLSSLRAALKARFTAHLAVATAAAHVLLLVGFIAHAGPLSLEGFSITGIPALLWAWILTTALSMPREAAEPGWPRPRLSR